MRNFIRIVGIRLDEALDISRFRYAEDAGVKIGIILYKVIRLLLYFVLFAGVWLLFERLGNAGLYTVLPTMAYFFASLICVFLTILNINEILTGNEDSEFLLSTPISGSVHAIIMFLNLYVRCLPFVFMFSVPAAVIYTRYVTVSGFWGYWVLCTLMTSLPLGGIACLLGTVIVLTLAHHPKKEQIYSGISLALILLGSLIVVVIANRMGAILTATEGNSQEIAEQILRMFVQNFRFPRMYQYALMEHNVAYRVVFPIVSLVWYVGFGFAFGMGYRVMIISFRCPVECSDYEWEDQKQTSLEKAMFQKEWQQLIRSKTYMVKIISGLMVGLLVALSTLFFGAGLLTRFLSVPQILLAICTVVGFGNTTYCSLSIDGRRHWIVESVPLDDSVLFEAKVRVNLVFTIPFSVISGLILGATVGVSSLWRAAYVFVPVLYAVLVAYWGIFIDRKFGDYSKESEQQAMHQGFSYVLGYLPGILLPILLILAL